MAFEMPKVPRGSGQHAIAMAVISANNLAASSEFYSKTFGWQIQPMSAELSGVLTPGGPTVALRSNIPAGFPGMVPYIGVPDVDAALKHVVAAGGSTERAPWRIPGVGKLARFTEPGGTLYGLTDSLTPYGAPHVPMPIGSNPKPSPGAICHVEMYAADGHATARFFGQLFGWGTAETMPQYVAFDPGAGIGGLFQSHTPKAPAKTYIYVADVEAKLAEIVAAGCHRAGNPIRMPGAGCFGYFDDPSGTSMGLIGP